MNDFPPLPHFLTLDEAAQAVADRTGKPWTARQILGCAERHEITVFARIDRAAKFVRVQPTDGRTNKIAADAGSLPILGAKAVQALLLTGEASSTGWEEPATVDFFGEPVRAWARAFELAQGEEPPRVTMGDCRVTAHGVLELVALYTAEPDEPQEAPQAAALATDAPPEAAPAAGNAGAQKKTTPAQEAEIVELFNRGRGISVRKLAPRFGVTRPVIDRVLRDAGVKARKK